MASLPKPELPREPLRASELLRLYGTPEFEAEYRRQMLAVAERDQATGRADRWPLDWEALEGEWE